MLDKRFVIVGGKGGVGRTVVSVALATLLARRGRRVLLAHARSKQRLSRLLGCEDRFEIDEQIREVEPNLWAVNMTPEAALREKGLMVLRFKAVYRAVLENRIVKYFLRAVPALSEYSMLGKVWYHTTELVGGRPRFDTVIFDGPAMGHLITMLRIPQVIAETVPEGPLSADAREVLGLLRDPSRTCLSIVTLAEEMPAREAVELLGAARNDLEIAPDRLIVNALYPPALGDPGQAELLAGLASAPLDSELAALCASAQTMRARREINERHLRQLAHQVPLPQVELPHLFVPEITRREVDGLAAILERSL